MTRTERLLHLMQTLRRRKQPASARELASELGISTRTLYRDIDTLRNQGADIAGEPGIGFILRHDSALPPLQFTADEIAALVFGIRAVTAIADSDMAQHADSALAKIRAVLPPHILDNLDRQSLYPLAQRLYAPHEQNALILIRTALQQERQLTFAYCDAEGRTSRRTVWPIAVGYFEQARVIAAWCTLRQAFRHFRADRISDIALGDPIPMPHAYLMQRWQQATGIHPNAAKHC